MRVELGALKIELDEDDDVEAFFRGLFRHFNNMELSDMLGVSPKTVTRWKRDGRLPGGPGKGLTMLELLGAMKGPAETPGMGGKTETRGANPLGAGGGQTAGGNPPNRPGAVDTTYSSSSSSSP